MKGARIWHTHMGLGWLSRSHNCKSHIGRAPTGPDSNPYVPSTTAPHNCGIGDLLEEYVAHFASPSIVKISPRSNQMCRPTPSGIFETLLSSPLVCCVDYQSLRLSVHFPPSTPLEYFTKPFNYGPRHCAPSSCGIVPNGQSRRDFKLSSFASRSRLRV